MDGCVSTYHSLQKPSFIVGTMVGFGITTLLFQTFVTLAHYNQLHVGVKISGDIQHEASDVIGNALPEGYRSRTIREVKSDEGYIRTSQQMDDDIPIVDNFDSFWENIALDDEEGSSAGKRKGGGKKSSKGLLKDVAKRKMLHTAVLSREDATEQYSTAIHMTWGSNLAGIRFYSPQGSKPHAAGINHPYTTYLEGLFCLF
jgi:hypothetical protein